MLEYPNYIKNLPNLTIPHFQNVKLKDKIPHSYYNYYYDPVNKFNNTETTFSNMYISLISEPNFIIDFLDYWESQSRITFNTTLDQINRILDVTTEKAKKSFYLTSAFFYIYGLLEDVIFLITYHI